MATTRNLPPFMMNQNGGKKPAAKKAAPFKPCSMCKSGAKCKAAGKCMMKGK